MAKGCERDGWYQFAVRGMRTKLDRMAILARNLWSGGDHDRTHSDGSGREGAQGATQTDRWSSASASMERSSSDGDSGSARRVSCEGLASALRDAATKKQKSSGSDQVIGHEGVWMKFRWILKTAGRMGQWEAVL